MTPARTNLLVAALLAACEIHSIEVTTGGGDADTSTGPSTTEGATSTSSGTTTTGTADSTGTDGTSSESSTSGSDTTGMTAQECSSFELGNIDFYYSGCCEESVMPCSDFCVANGFQECVFVGFFYDEACGDDPALAGGCDLDTWEDLEPIPTGVQCVCA